MAAPARASVWVALLWRMAPTEATAVNCETQRQRDTLCIASTEQRRAAPNEDLDEPESGATLGFLGHRF